MSVVPETWSGRERVEPVDPRSCRAPSAPQAGPAAAAVPLAVPSATVARRTAWLRGLDRLSARRPDAVGSSPLALVALDALRAAV